MYVKRKKCQLFYYFLCSKVKAAAIQKSARPQINLLKSKM